MKYCTKITPSIFSDSRGEILTFLPDEKIVEFNMMITKQGDARGYHYHPHFIEYILIVHGSCCFKEFYQDETSEIILNVGDCLRIPSYVAHTFIATSDLKFISLLTKRWNDSDPPIVKVTF